MKQGYLLGIDIGTSGIKTVLTDFAGRRKAQHQHSYATLERQPGFVEQDADTAWWAGAKAGIAACLAGSGVASGEIAGICASGMVPNLCPLDENGRPVRPAILYRDNRAIEQAARLKARFGWGFSLQDVAPKLLWLKENEPENYARIATVLNAHSYIAYRLTGVLSADHDVAAIFGEVYDEENHCWLPGRMRDIGLDARVLPPLHWPTDILGGVSAEAARETGLAEGTPVVAGTGDSFTILVGTGTVEAGEGLIYLGTAATFLGLETSLDAQRGSSPFITGGARFLGNVLTGGEITRWFTQGLLSGAGPGYTELEAAAAALPPGSEGLYTLPHLLGERTPAPDPLARGVLFGLTNTHTAGHAYRASLEGVAYALRHSYQHNRLPLSRLAVGGGGCNCLLWRQILADVLGRELCYLPKADNALGTSFLAGMALGIFQSYNTVRDEWLSECEVIRPSPTAVKQYEAGFAFYLHLNELVRPAYALRAAAEERMREIEKGERA